MLWQLGLSAEGILKDFGDGGEDFIGSRVSKDAASRASGRLSLVALDDICDEWSALEW
jgi:hypothetical protein